MPAKPIPEGYSAITPYLSVQGASDAIEFYKNAFGAEEIYRMEMPGGLIGHAEIKIGGCFLMLADQSDQGEFGDPKSLNGCTAGIHLFVEDVDNVYAKAVSSGAKVVREVEDQFYGDRSGTLEDPFGHVWFVSTRIEDLSPEEIGARAEELFSGAEG